MTHTQDLRDIANEVAITRPDLGRRLHQIANKVRTMEAFLDDAVEQAQIAERLHVLNETGVVVVPGVRWGRG
jgi:ethanolamine ammonia-lyase small subunit